MDPRVKPEDDKTTVMVAPPVIPDLSSHSCEGRNPGTK
jgi:hypothetical protein